MATMLREHKTLLLALTTGALVGAGMTLLLQRLGRNLAADIAQLAAKVDSLKREVTELKSGLLPEDASLEVTHSDVLQLGSGIRRQTSSTYFSVSSEDEDDFQDTIEGTEDIPTTRRDDGVVLGEEVRTEQSVVGSAGHGGAGDGVGLGVGLESPSAVLHKADMLLEGSEKNKDEAFTLLKSAQKKFERNPEYLWRMSKATYLQSQKREMQGSGDAKKDLVYAASDLACQALDITDNNSQIHKWCAITIGSRGDYEPTQVRISNGFKFKEHIERAIELTPTDPSSHYLLGRWCYGVYMLSWVERKLAATLFATPPSATVDEALGHFLKADELQPGQWKENLLYIAKCYVEKGQYATAVSWLDKAKLLPVVGSDDEVAEKEVDSLLKTYSSYRKS